MVTIRWLPLALFLVFMDYNICSFEDIRLPLGMRKELYCEGCEATIKEMDKNLTKVSIDSVTIKIVEALDWVCSPAVFRIYKWSPPKMAKACNFFTSTYDEELEEKLFEQYKKPGKPKLALDEFVDEICYHWTGACKDVDRDYQPDENVDSPDGEGMPQYSSPQQENEDGIRQMNMGGGEEEEEYESEYETDAEGEGDGMTEAEKQKSGLLKEGNGTKPERNRTADEEKQLKKQAQNIIEDDVESNKPIKKEKKRDDDDDDDDEDEEAEKRKKKKVVENTGWTEDEKRKRKEENFIDDDEDDGGNEKGKKVKDEL